MTKGLSESKKLDEGKSPEQLFAERMRRFDDAAALKQPDRIPLILGLGNMVADLAGITRLEFLDDGEKQTRALTSSTLRFQPDFVNPDFVLSSAMSRALGDRMTKFPGYGLSENQSFQFHEQEFMKAEDYDAFIADTADWAFRKYLPRAFSELEGLAMLPNLGMATSGFFGMASSVVLLGAPPIAKAIEALTKAAIAQHNWYGERAAREQSLAALGYPIVPIYGPIAFAPFDYMSNTLRGMRGVFLDMKRCPEKLLAAQEKVTAMQVESAIAMCRMLNLTKVFVPLHRGSDGFISTRDFERFYWPQLKNTLAALIDAGIMPTVFYEGNWNSRLHYLTELPKGKTIGWFQTSDMFKVKEVLGDTMCIMGGMKVSMLSGAVSAEEIRDYTRKLCREVGKGGGFLMSTDISEMESANPEMIQVWVDSTREFGIY